MNKKLLLGTALVLSLTPTFTSCIDDTESASVTNIRNAKAEMLKSMAELNSANAQAALILANAQAAVQEASADFYKAQAEYQKALAAYQNAQTDAAKQKLAIELEQMQVSLEQAKANLQSTLARLEADIARYKWEALDYQQQYDKLLAQADKDKADEIRKLLTAYEDASKTLIDAKRNLATQTAQLAKLEAGLVSLPESVNSEIATLEEENAGKQVEIDGQKALIATYEKYAGKEVSEEEIHAARIKYLEAQEALNEADVETVAAQEAQNTQEEALTNYYDNTVKEWVKGYNNLSYIAWNETTERNDLFYVRIQKVTEQTAPATARGKYCVVIKEYPDFQDLKQTTYLPLFDDETYEDKTLDYTTSTGTQTASWTVYKTYYNLIDNGKALETVISHKENELSQAKLPETLESLKKELPELQKAQADAQKAFDDAAKAYTDALAAEATPKKTYEDARDAANIARDKYYNNTDPAKEEELRKASEEADTAESEAWKAYNTAMLATQEARNEKQAALNELDYATSLVNETMMKINENELAVENLTAQINELKDKVATLIEAGKANETNISACNKAKDNYYTTYYSVYVPAWNAKEVAENEYNAIRYGGVIGGDYDVNQIIADANQKIENLNQEIADNEATIESLKERLADIEAGTDSEVELKQEQIDTIKDLIEKYTVAVDVAQQKYDMAKDELEAAVKSDSAE